MTDTPSQMTNCHVHTFTHVHTPARFVPWPLPGLLKVGWLRRALLGVVMHFDRGRRSRLARFGQILDVSYQATQEDVFTKVRGYYPKATRFVVLPMDMELMGAGQGEEPIAEQHRMLALLRDSYSDIVIPFAAADPRRSDVFETTVNLIEEHQFRGIKLYPPIGYHPNHPRLQLLYAYAAERAIPVLTHCSRPASVQFRGTPTDEMRIDPVSGQRLVRKDPKTGATRDLSRLELLTVFTDPAAYVPILQDHPRLTLCLAHFGGAGDWEKYLEDQWIEEGPDIEKSWLAEILDLIRSKNYSNLYTDIAYTVFANDEYAYLLKVLLADEQVATKVLFGSDFYVVENAELEERHRAMRVRAVIGEDLFHTIARENPRRFLGES